jgi:hypothetical protein
VAQKFTVPITVKQLTSTGSDAITVFIDADVYARLKLEAGGRITWGPGSGAGDTNLYRDSANVLKTDDTFKANALFVNDIQIDPSGASVDHVLKYNGTKFVSASATFGGGGGGASVTVSNTAPVGPVIGDLWFDSTSAKMFVYYDSYWIEIGNPGVGQKVTVSSSAPPTPVQGELWFDSDDGTTYIYYNSVWIEIGATASELLINTIDAKGDLFVGTADNTVSKISVGTNGQLLSANSSTATGLEWTTPNYAPTVSPTFTGTVTLPSSTSIGSVDSTELGYLDGVSSSIQTQLNAKASTGKAIAMSIVFGG